MESHAEILSLSKSIFSNVAEVTSVFVLPLFLLRVILANLTGQGGEVLAALKSVFFYFLLITGFPLILELLFAIPDSFLPAENSNIFAANDPLQTESGFALVPDLVGRVLEMIIAGLYWVIYFLHFFFMMILCSMAPIVFLLGTLLGIGLGIEIFLGLLVIASSWPIIWYGVGQAQAQLMTPEMDGFGAQCLELLLIAIKGVGPTALAFLSVSSPPGRAVLASTLPAISLGSSSGKFVWNKSREMMFPRGVHWQSALSNKSEPLSVSTQYSPSPNRSNNPYRSNFQRANKPPVNPKKSSERKSRETSPQRNV